MPGSEVGRDLWLGLQVGGGGRAGGARFGAIVGVLSSAPATLGFAAQILHQPPANFPAACMSSAEIRALRAEIEALRLRVKILEDKTEERAAPSYTEAEIGGAPSSSGFIEVSEVGDYESRREPCRFVSRAGFLDPNDLDGRADWAREAGQFLLRAIRGERLGTSGRDRLKLQSQVYVVLAGHEGRVYDQPKVFYTFGPVKEICKRGPSCGRSIFLGFPTSWEAKIAVETAQLQWPKGY